MTDRVRLEWNCEGNLCSSVAAIRSLFSQRLPMCSSSITNAAVSYESWFATPTGSVPLRLCSTAWKTVGCSRLSGTGKEEKGIHKEK